MGNGPGCNRYISNGQYADPPAKGVKRPAACFMENTDFGQLTETALKLKRRVGELVQYTIIMENEAKSRHKNKLSSTKADVSAIVDDVSELMTQYIEEFYREQECTI